VRCTRSQTPPISPYNQFPLTTDFPLQTPRYPLLALPNAVRACSNAAAAYTRITDYLRRPHYTDKRELLDGSRERGVVQLLQLPVGPKTVLRNWKAEQGSLWVLQGPVGSFKSTILECIAGHGVIAPGARVRVGGSMSYAPQVPWLQQTSIKHNILCNEAWNEARYKAVLHACALEHDLKAMPMGDDTPVAEKGLSLSGGQRQRVALARCAYREADTYVLDNPISAIDGQTQEHIWTHLIEGLLRDSTVIVASSRAVISCTAIMRLSPNGLVDEAQVFGGWCSPSLTQLQPPHPLPPRYLKSRTAASDSPSSHVSSAHASPVPQPFMHQAPTNRSRATG